MPVDTVPQNELDHPVKELRRNSSEPARKDQESAGHALPFQRVRWYLSRLASMQPAEIVWRARSAAQLPLDWATSKAKPSAPTPHWEPLQPAAYPVKLHQGGAWMDHVHVFDLEFPVDFEFDWHRDYRYEKQVERRFAGTLNIRDNAVVSDIKYVWEPSRFQHLSALAYAGNAEQHADAIARALTSWLRENPYLSGVNWTSSLELGIRIVSWALLYPRIADQVARDENFRRQWLDSIYRHLARISRKLSLYSSANNHLLGELTGLFVGASCFNFWPECSAWRRLAQEKLESEILLQVGADGVNREQAMSYHLFTMEMLLLAFIVGNKTNAPFSAAYAGRLKAMAGFLDTVATPGGNLPWYGDSDDARGFVLSESESGLQVVMQLAGLLFSDPRWLRFGKTPTAATSALLPELLGNLNYGSPTKATRRELFADAGLAHVRTDGGDVGLMMDFGPLGFTSIAAHGHADALAVWLSIGDEFFLVDAGTYAYHSHEEWRKYFRGTAAHNTARVDGRDQSEMKGRFLWGAKSNSRLLRFEENAGLVMIEAEHDGYTRLEDPVTHRRCVVFDRKTGNVSIEDSFQCAGRHEVELFFHLHEESAVHSVRDGDAEIHWRGQRILFSSPDRNGHWQIFRGAEDPRLGWRSHRFNQKQPSPTLRVQAEISGSTTIRTHIKVNA